MSTECGNDMMNRRSFLTSAAAGVFGPYIAGCGPRARKPNLLFLWTDEQRADTMAAYGNANIHTPNLNAFAEESVVFRNAYVSQPVCTPSRSTVLTGQWPHGNTCVENNIPLPAEIPCFPELINDSEYRTGYFGKWHLGDEVFCQHGFDEWESIEDIYWQYFRPGRDKTTRSSYSLFLKEHGYEPDNEERNQFSRSFAASLPLEHSKPKFLETKACDFILRHRNEPFILHVNFLEPHMPFYGPLDDEHTFEEVGFPGNFNDPLEDNEPLRYRLLRERYRRNGFEGLDLDTESGWRRLICNYWGLCTQVDMSVGSILSTLEMCGIADNTIVVYTSDHGDMMGCHRLLAKTVMYEESVKVPLMMRIPSLGRIRRTVEEPVSHIDLVPTLLDLMGVRRTRQLPGHSLKPLIIGGQPVEDHIFIEWNPALLRGSTPHSIPDVSADDVKRVHASATRTVISPDGWKLCLSDRDNCQLFNIAKDPGETTNLYYSGQHRDVISSLTGKILEWQETVNDTVSVVTA